MGQNDDADEDRTGTTSWVLTNLHSKLMADSPTRMGFTYSVNGRARESAPGAEGGKGDGAER